MLATWHRVQGHSTASSLQCNTPLSSRCGTLHRATRQRSRSRCDTGPGADHSIRNWQRNRHDEEVARKEERKQTGGGGGRPGRGGRPGEAVAAAPLLKSRNLHLTGRKTTLSRHVFLAKSNERLMLSHKKLKQNLLGYGHRCTMALRRRPRPY